MSAAVAVSVVIAGALYLGIAREAGGRSSAAGATAELHAARALDVVALGRLTPRGHLVSLAPPFGTADARIARLFVQDGQTVDAGVVIAELDNLPMLEAAVAVAEGNVAAQQAALDKARSNAASALREATAEMERARAVASLATAQANRHRRLFADGLVAKATLEEVESHQVRAEQELERASAQWERQHGDDGQPDVAVAISLLEVARRSLSHARAQAEGGLVVAPFKGTVITLRRRVGEKVGSEGIASFGDLEAMQAELEVYQTDIARVAPGQRVVLESLALPEPLHGTVDRIGWEVERQSVLASDPSANTDARVVRTLVLLDVEGRALAARLSGLQVTGRIKATP